MSKTFSNTLGWVIPTVVLCLATVTAGVVHGRFSGRWGTEIDRAEGGAALKNLPETIGPWRAVRQDPLSPSVVKILQCDGYVNRVYENTTTGDQVAIALLLGPTGPISVHTPEICYSARDYKITQNRARWSVTDAAGLSHEFWDLRLQANDLSNQPLRAIYGWTNGSQFAAVEQPRFSYGGSPYLYKIQLAGPVPPDSGTPDVCAEFLAAFLPALSPHMLDSN